jgi:hypothetical protein
MLLLLALLSLQNDELTEIQARIEKLDKIPSIDSAIEEVQDISKKLVEIAKKNNGEKFFQANELNSQALQTVGKRCLIANQLNLADEFYGMAIQACKANVDKAKAEMDAAAEPTEEMEKRVLFSGYYYIIAIHHRAYALRSDPKKLDLLEKQVVELEEYFKVFFNLFDTYFLALEGATYLGRCHQYLAELTSDRFAVADQHWAKCFHWLAKGRELVNLREMRDHPDAHQVSARAVLCEIQARILCAKQLRAAGGPWERQIIHAQNAARHLFSVVPSLRGTQIGQKIKTEAAAASKLLE